MLDNAFMSDFTSTFIFTETSVVVSVSTGRTEENVVSMYTVTLLLLIISWMSKSLRYIQYPLIIRLDADGIIDYLHSRENTAQLFGFLN